MDAQVLIHSKIPELKAEFAMGKVQLEPFTLVLNRAGEIGSSFERNTGSEWLLILQALPKGVRMTSNLGIYDASSLGIQVQQEIHTGQMRIENLSHESKTIELVRLYEYN